MGRAIVVALSLLAMRACTGCHRASLEPNDSLDPYLYVSSIFPGLAGASLLVLAVMMILASLFPRIEEQSGRG